MMNPSQTPKILFVTPRVLFYPKNGFFLDEFICHQNGRDTDFLSFLISDLYHLGADVHVVLPEYRKIFSSKHMVEDKSACSKMPGNRVHLAKDRIFYHTNDIDANCDWENIRISIAFQREVIQHFIPLIQPDLIHCHGWMSGLIPAAAKEFGIPCLYTIHELKTQKIPLSCVEDMGIDAALFWNHLFYDRMPAFYEETRANNPADLLLSGILSATHIDAVGTPALMEMIRYLGGNKKTTLGHMLEKKFADRYLSIISNGVVRTQAYINIYEQLLKKSIINHSDMDEIEMGI